MTSKTFTPSRVFFFSSALLPYLIDLFPSHPNSTINVLFFDFIALMVLAVSALVLAAGTRELRSNGKGLIYLAIAPAIVILYFYSLDVRMELQKRIDFYVLKPEMEVHVAQINRGLSTADSLRFRNYNLYEGDNLYKKLLSGIVLCTTEGEASVYYAGYAYSPENKRPSESELAKFNGEFYEWRKVADHWYRWGRRDN